MSALLELDGVSKTYEMESRIIPRLLGRRRPLLAVNNVSLTATRGEVLGLVGESGCGKSTLARIILRLDAPSDGRILFDGHDIAPMSRAALKPFRRRIQMVFQDANSSLNPRKSVARLIGEALAEIAVPEADRRERGAELLKLVGLDGAMLDRYPHELSGGQRQRMAIARALAMGPELLVADEPVSSLDVSLQAQILRLLMDLRSRLGLTMIFISHDLALVHHLCSSVAVMCAGSIVEQGETRRILHDPAHEYTRKLLGSVVRRRYSPIAPVS
ncbi:MAG: ABC transporter ATP-binding protein [Hyphomicrobiales bacterium]|nr:ABC transporter ATP-binding protein [Hyphomicrobiales bacterium]